MSCILSLLRLYLPTHLQTSSTETAKKETLEKKKPTDAVLMFKETLVKKARARGGGAGSGDGGDQEQRGEGGEGGKSRLADALIRMNSKLGKELDEFDRNEGGGGDAAERR